MRRAELLHFLHAAEILLKLCDLAQVLHDFLLGQHIEGAVFLHLLQLMQTVHAGAHGLEVGQHAAQPAGVDIVHADAGGLFRMASCACFLVPTNRMVPLADRSRTKL
jgi:hypothetical protein